ncbi:MAG: RNase adapter RapZ [Candidatus Aminicenantes bacterium]|nr:RNase adapter RapZ [Candidatus Aminicenantes bacterium]
MKDEKFLIITGVSGSGKTVASRFLEDLGYYCIDNLPSKLIPSFVKLWSKKEVEIGKVALVVDVREPGFSTGFAKVLRSIREKISPLVLFLETSDSVLIKRFSESRRPHPLSKGRSIMEAVALERKSVAEIKNLSDEVIDTSQMSILELKKLLTRKYSKKRSIRLQVMIVSFGYKYGIPLDSDLVFDTRFLPNPFYIDDLRSKTGRSSAVKDFILNSTETKKYMGELFRHIDYLMPKFIDERKTNLTISIGCTGGKHRSVVLSNVLKDHLRDNNYSVRINHRDIYK